MVNIKTTVLTFIVRHKRLLSVAGTALLSAYFIFSLIFSELGLIKYISMKGEYNNLKKEISRIETDNRQLRKDVEALKTDPDYIEALARERLGLAKEGEIIYRFQP